LLARDLILNVKKGKLMNGNGKDEVYAEVSPRSVGGTSLFDPAVSITADNVREFRSEDSDVADARRELLRLGFQVLLEGPTTLSISGPATLYEDVFGIALHRQTREIMQGVEVEFFAPPDELSHQPLEAPGDLSNLVEGVAIAEPPLLFESALPPIAQPDPAAYRYLFMPDDAALILRATGAHRTWGITGRDVVVAMIDTGHYRHPFFTEHQYRLLPVLLAPGAVNPAEDSNGHGTGESANIFATAPDCQLLPIKDTGNSAAAINAAVNATPTPQIISNSWGYDVDYPGSTLHPFLMTVEAAVANAVANGIVVCFPARNGHQAFPGSHPDVISVGGARQLPGPRSGSLKLC
jgi:hypothetical protein